MTSQIINLDMIPQGVAPIIHVSQYDKGQTWQFNLFFGDSAFTVPVGASVTIQGTKPDNTGFQYSCTFSGSVVTATEQEQMTIIAGKVPCELAIMINDELLASLNFYIWVEPAALSDHTQISETDLPLIQEIIEDLPIIEEAVEDLPLIVQYKKDAEAWAVGTRDGVPVESDDPTYHHNSKYYADNCIGMITDAQYSSLQTIFS